VNAGPGAGTNPGSGAAANPAPRKDKEMHMQTQRRKVAWIGLGIMGSPMAENLIAAGHDVTGYTLEPDRLARLEARGGTAAGSVAEAVAEADVIVTMVPASPQVEAVAYGEDGILAHARKGALLIDMSSITPQTSIDLARAAAEKGIRVLDAPVSGGEAGAVEAVLSIMVGGDAEDFADARPVLDALGTTVVLCGPHGAGQTVKAANQLIVAVNIQACAEAVVFLEKSGVDLSAALDVLGGGLAGSTVLARKKANFLGRQYAPGFRIDLHHKDMGIVTDAARTVGAALPVGSVVAGLVASLRAQGDGGLDHSALLLGVERLSGQPVRG
jgi:2-hydroxy-3-oxopropionate reductase